jgi:uncharacterized protein
VPRFDRSEAGSGPLVRAIATDGRFIVDDGAESSILLTPQLALAWRPPELAKLTAEDVEVALRLDPAPEFLLLGTGPTLARPPLAFVRDLENRGIGVEAMDSRAAARTWAVLRAEERWIAAALMPL